MAIGDRDKWLPAGGTDLWGHKNFGNQIRVEVEGSEVRLVFVSTSSQKANALADDLLTQVKRGSIKINIGGKITGVVEE